MKKTKLSVAQNFPRFKLTSKNSINILSSHSRLLSALLAIMIFTFFTVSTQAATIAKTNDLAGSADNDFIIREVTFTIDDIAANSVISDVNISVNFEKISGTCPTHIPEGYPFNKEIYIFLTSPDGTQVALVEDNKNSSGSGAPATYYSQTDYGGEVTILFDDSAATLVGGPAPATGPFRPVQPLAAFIGEDPLGSWKLTLGDSKNMDPLCFYEYMLIITADQPPSVDDQIFSIPENSADSTSVGAVSATDPDTGDKLTYAITAGDPTGVFAIDENTGEITVADGSQLDFELPPTSYGLTVEVSDSTDLTDTATITINVTDANDAPTDISLDNNSIAEHEAASTTIGSFTTTDQDTTDSHTYSLVAGAGDTGNGSFTIFGDLLLSAEEFDYETQSSYSIRLRTDDGNGGTFEKQFTINISDANDPPTDITLDNEDVDENQPVSTLVGTFTTTDLNVSDTFTYTLASGDGDTDNGSFSINGDQLETAATFDFEVDDSYSIRVQTNDGNGHNYQKAFTITINDSNDDPTDISLDNNTVAENQSVGTAVGNFSTTDQDAADNHTYELVTGTGDTDNASFTIVSNELQTAVSFDFESKSSYSIRVETDDDNGGTFEEVFAITITDNNDAPTDISLDNDTVAEHKPAGTTVGSFSSEDQDSAASHTYNLVTGTGDTDNGSFNIVGVQLQTAAEFDFESKEFYFIRIQSDDGQGGTYDKAFTITVTDANDPPTDISLNNNDVDENQPSGTAVGTLTTTDLNGTDTFTYTLVSGGGDTDNASFSINVDQLETAAVFDFEVDNSYSIRVQTNDGNGHTFQKAFTIDINDINDDPTDINLDNNTIAENQPIGTVVGEFSTDDQDSADTHTYSLVPGMGSMDNGSFSIAGSDLNTAEIFDFETKDTYNIRVQSMDSGGITVTQPFTITITDANDPSTDVTLDNNTVNENQAVGTNVGSFNTTDPDASDSFIYSFAAGAGDADNGSFSISGSDLNTAEIFDYETKDTYNIRVQSMDSGGITVTQPFTITILDINDPPTAVDDNTDSTDEDSTLTILAPGVLTNDFDQDLDPVTVVPASGTSASGAGVSVAADGSYIYNPAVAANLQALAVGESLVDTFSYTATDNTLTATATVSVTVTGVNDAPTGENDTAVTKDDTAVIIPVLDNDDDPDTSDILSITSFTQGSTGIVSDNLNGTLTYSPTLGTTGSITFTYTVEDGHGGIDNAMVTVIVSPAVYEVFLPVVLNNYVSAPDLVVNSVAANDDTVEVVVENIGPAATNSGFWVDFYVAPQPVPTAANQLWPSLSTEGIAWGVTVSIAAGDVLTLTYSTAPGAPNLYVSTAETNFSGSLPGGTPIYAQVDSAHLANVNGGILETHEVLGSPYNNIGASVASAGPLDAR